MPTIDAAKPHGKMLVMNTVKGNLDTIAAELHAQMLTLPIGGWCWAPNRLMRVRREADDTFSYTKNGLKTSGSATGIASIVTLMGQTPKAPVTEDAVSRKRIVDFCESLKDGVYEKKGRKTNADYALIGAANTISEFAQTLLPLEK
jgi:hypothetical protein